MKLLCSTGAFSRFPDITNYQSIVRYGPELPVDGFEVMAFSTWTREIEHIASALQQSGLNFPAIHAQKDICPLLISLRAEERDQGRRWLEAGCRLGQVLQSRIIVLHLWGLPTLDDEMERNLAILGECIDTAERYGLQLAVETIPGRTRDPVSNVRMAIEHDTRAVVALDTEFLAMYGQIDAAMGDEWLWENERVQHIHIKDYDGQMRSADNHRRYLHPGEGSVDFPRFFSGLKERRFDGYISLEASIVAPDGSHDFAKLKRSLELLRMMVK